MLAEADTLKTWQMIYDSFRRYRQCDDGALAEGYSESIVTTLANRWDQLPSQALIAHDRSFRYFVFRHIERDDGSRRPCKHRKERRAQVSGRTNQAVRLYSRGRHWMEQKKSAIIPLYPALIPADPLNQMTPLAVSGPQMTPVPAAARRSAEIFIDNATVFNRV